MTTKPRKRDPSYTTLDCTFSPWCIETISLHPSTELHRIEQPIISGRHTTTTSSALNPSIQEGVAPESVRPSASRARFCVLIHLGVVPVSPAVPRRKKAKIIPFGVKAVN